jgi:hypothetical protein
MELEALRQLEDVFGKMAEAQMRECGLEALRSQARLDEHTTRRSITLNHWYRALLGVVISITVKESAAPGQLTLGKLESIPISPTSMGAIYAHHIHVRRFWQWMESTGFALRFGHNHDQPGGPNYDQWVLTDLGVERLRADPKTC